MSELSELLTEHGPIFTATVEKHSGCRMVVVKQRGFDIAGGKLLVSPHLAKPLAEHIAAFSMESP